MPVVHEYMDRSGIYIRTALDGTFVTYQVHPNAASLFEQLGYDDGDSVNWQIIKPLWDDGYVYTGGSGTDQTELDELDLDADDAPKPSTEEKNELAEFLSTESDPEFSVPGDILEVLHEWIDDDLTEKRAASMFEEANDPETCFRSVRQFNKYSLPIDHVNFGKGDPVYTITHRGMSIRCIDLRRAQQNLDFIFVLANESTISQSLKISHSLLQGWTIYEQSTQEEYFPDLLEYLPEVARLCRLIEDYNFKIEQWDFQQTSGNSVSESTANSIDQIFANILRMDRDLINREEISGVTELVYGISYGFVTVTNGESTALLDQSNLGNDIETETEVVFDGIEENEYPWATNIRRQSSDEEVQEPIQSSTIDLPEDVVSIIEEWADEPQIALNTTELHLDFDVKVSRIIRSIRSFHAHPDSLVTGLEVGKTGNLIYTLRFEEREGYWTCEHHLSSETAEFEIELFPDGAPNQKTRVVDGMFKYWNLISTAGEAHAKLRHDLLLSQHEFIDFVSEYIGQLERYSFRTLN
jgi:hypothetical protein